MDNSLLIKMQKEIDITSDLLLQIFPYPFFYRRSLKYRFALTFTSLLQLLEELPWAISGHWSPDDFERPLDPSRVLRMKRQNADAENEYLSLFLVELFADSTRSTNVPVRETFLLKLSELLELRQRRYDIEDALRIEKEQHRHPMASGCPLCVSYHFRPFIFRRVFIPEERMNMFSDAIKEATNARISTCYQRLMIEVVVK